MSEFMGLICGKYEAKEQFQRFSRSWRFFMIIDKIFEITGCNSEYRKKVSVQVGPHFTQWWHHMDLMQNVLKKLPMQNKIQNISEKVKKWEKKYFDVPLISSSYQIFSDQLAFMFESSNMLAITKYGQKTCEVRDNRTFLI